MVEGMSDVFYAYTKGRGEGCDYTIGCNLKIERLKATTMEAAIVEATGEGWSKYDDERIETITILRVAEEADCGERIAALRAERETAKRGAGQAAKRAQLERLKRELGEA